MIPNYRELKVFLCPTAEGILNTAFTGGGGPDACAGQMIGYADGIWFFDHRRFS